MVLIPISTDAPVYHWPLATVGLILANTAIFVAISLVPDPSAFAAFALVLGDGLHPLQWLTHNFLHGGILHLVFNMVFLWAYGLIVEGKVGWLVFLLCYLGIGTAHGAVIQAAYLNASEPGIVLGASAIIFGLMAICMIWAPANDLTCFYFFFLGFRVFTNVTEIRVYVVVLLQIALESLGLILTWTLRGDPMSSSLLHLSGVIWGLLLGTFMIKAGWVDCEGWDIFSLVRKRAELDRSWKARTKRLDRNRENDRPARNLVIDNRARPGETPQERSARQLHRLHHAIAAGDSLGIETAFRDWIHTFPAGVSPPRIELMEIIRALQTRKLHDASVPPMRVLCRYYPEGAERVRLKLASILVRQMSRPTEARRHLQQIAPGSLDPALDRLRQQLIAEADAQIDDGVLELEEDEI